MSSITKQLFDGLTTVATVARMSTVTSRRKPQHRGSSMMKPIACTFALGAILALAKAVFKAKELVGYSR